MGKHLQTPSLLSPKLTPVLADIFPIGDSENSNAEARITLTQLKTLVLTALAAGSVDVTPSGNLTATEVQEALEDLQTSIDNLTTSNAAENFIATAADPVAGDGVDGDYHLALGGANQGAITGPKAGGAWPAVGNLGNAFSAINLSSAAGAAPTAGGSAGTATTAARGDHTHPLQDTIYVANGTLTGARTIDKDGNALTFSGGGNVLITGGDLEINDGTGATGTIYRSANGSRFRVTVDNDGSLTTTNV
ncbi:MAG: hypothetical protein AAFX06_29675 [Planctomycetota bacterium]